MTRFFRTVLFVSAITFFSVIIFPLASEISNAQVGRGRPGGLGAGGAGGAGGGGAGGVAQFTDCTQLGIACGSNLVGYITKILGGILALVGLVAVIYVIWAGVKYITSAGDEKKAGEAKDQILYAVIGIIVIAISAAIVNFIIGAIN